MIYDPLRIAMESLVPGARYISSDSHKSIVWKPILSASGQPTGEFEPIPSNIEWLDDRPFPSKDALDAAYVAAKEDYAAKEYQRHRLTEYPPISDLADALYWQAQGDDTKMTAYLAAVEAVKQKYPKP